MRFPSRSCAAMLLLAAISTLSAATDAERPAPLRLVAAAVLDAELELTFNRVLNPDERPPAIELHGGEQRRRVIEMTVTGRVAHALLDQPIYAGELVRAVRVGEGGADRELLVHNRSSLTVFAAVAVPDGGVVVAGGFDGAVRVGEQRLRSVGSSDIFVARANRDGRWSWAVRAGGPGFDEASGLALGPDGRIYVCGTHAVDPAPALAGATRDHDGAIFIGVLDPAGRWGWTQAVATDDQPGSNQARAVAVDGSGAVYVAGNFSGRLRAGARTVAAAGAQDVFLAKLAADGRWLWVLSGGGPGSDSVYALALDAQDRPLLTGEFLRGGRFGDGQRAGFSIEGPGWVPFAARASADGRWLWAAQPPDLVGAGQAIAAADDGVYIAGTAVEVGEPADAPPRAYLARWRGDGAFSWLRSLPRSGHSMALGLRIDASGAYLAGQFTPLPSDGSDSEPAGPQVFVATADPRTGRWRQVLSGGNRLLLPTAFAFQRDDRRLIIGGPREDQAFTSAGAPTIWLVEPEQARWIPLARLP